MTNSNLKDFGRRLVKVNGSGIVCSCSEIPLPRLIDGIEYLDSEVARVRIVRICKIETAINCF